MERSLMSHDDATLVASLKTCAKQKDLIKGCRIHSDILNRDLLNKNILIGNALINMYAKCGAFTKAQEVFERLEVQNRVSWNALIAGYSQHGHGNEALDCFEQMQYNCIPPDAVTFTSILGACGCIREASTGGKLHAIIAEAGLLRKDVVLGNALVDMYVKFGAFSKAQAVFNELPVRNVSTWNAVLSGYSQDGHDDKALDWFESMQHEGLPPNAVTFTCILKACASTKAIQKGMDIHARIVKAGLLGKDLVLDCALVDMHVRFGALQMAQELFDELPVRDIVTWTVVVEGLAQQGNADIALSYFDKMQHEGLCPDSGMYICILKACGSIGAMERAERIHADIARMGLLGQQSIVGTSLVDTYVKCSEFEKAEQVFECLPAQDVVSWNVLIAGYCQHNHVEQALDCFERMQVRDCSPDTITCACILKACGSIGSAEKGKKIHSQIVKIGLVKQHSILGYALIDMYAKCAFLSEARQVFDGLVVHDLLSWNALISGYMQHGHPEGVLNCFQEMRLEGFLPDAISFSCILKAYGSLGELENGKHMHDEIVKEGFSDKGAAIGNPLVDMYARCGAVVRAQQLFEKLDYRNALSWNALIVGYSQQGLCKEVIDLFKHMQNEGISPDAVTFACILKACGSLQGSDKGRQIHAEIVHRRLLGKDLVLGNVLVDMYAKSGALSKAQEVFNELFLQDVNSWNTLISGYVQNGHSEEALTCFERMQHDTHSPNAVTFTFILNACGHLGAVDKGRWIHAKIAKSKLLQKDSILGNALVDMYAKCGAVERAKQVFDGLPFRTIVSFNMLITGYSQHGHGEKALNCFMQMQCEGIVPDAVTFLCTMNACSSLGLIHEGEAYFNTMNLIYGVFPTIEHYTCMVDLFGRDGHFDKAVTLIKNSIGCEQFPLWIAFLGACRKLMNVKFGRLAFEHAVQLDEKSAVAYVYMSNIYTSVGNQDYADEIEAMRMKNEAWKLPGQCQWSDINGNIHSFCVRDKEHPKFKSITLLLDSIVNKIFQKGYCPALDLVPEDIHFDANQGMPGVVDVKSAVVAPFINTFRGVHS